MAEDLFRLSSKPAASTDQYTLTGAPDMPSIVGWVSGFGVGTTFVLGMIIFIIGLWIKKKIIESAVISANSQSNKSYDQHPRPVVKEEKKQCPDCAEWIQKQAILCRFCGHRYENFAIQHPGTPRRE